MQNQDICKKFGITNSEVEELKSLSTNYQIRTLAGPKTCNWQVFSSSFLLTCIYISRHLFQIRFPIYLEGGVIT